MLARLFALALFWMHQVVAVESKNEMGNARVREMCHL